MANQQQSHKPSPQAGGGSASVGMRKGRPVPIPSSALPALEQAHGPGRILLGKVKGKDESNKGCVQVKCVEDPRTFSFDTMQVRQWLATYPLLIETNTFVEADGLEQATKGSLQPSSKRARVERSSTPAENGTPPPISSSGMPSELEQDGFLPPPGPPRKGITRRGEVTDLLGKDVDVPGSVFHDYAPGVFFRAHVTGPDSGHASAVVLRLLINPKDRYYFHASEVRHWMRLTQARDASRQGDGGEQGARDDIDETLAAEVLAHMSGSSSDSPCAQPSLADAVPQPPLPASHPMDSGTPGNEPGPKEKTGKEGPGSKEKMEEPAPSPAGRPTAPPPPLQWSSSELVVQYPSVLPPFLAEELARIANACGGIGQAGKAESVAAAAAVAGAAAAAAEQAQRAMSQGVKQEGVGEFQQ